MQYRRVVTISVAAVLLVFLHCRVVHSEDVLVDKIRSLFDDWGIPSEERDPKADYDTTPDLERPRLLARFLESFTPKEWEEDEQTSSTLLRGEHPDVMFITENFAYTGEVFKGRVRSDQRDAHERLIELARGLSVELSDEVDRPTMEALLTLVDLIVKSRDYQEWLHGFSYDSRTEDDCPAEFPWKARPHPKVTEYVLRFVPPLEPTEKWAQEPAAKMVNQLNNWGVAGVTPTDAERRPWFIFRAYFELLSQRRFAKELEADASSWQAAFVRRLPKEPIASEFSLADDKGLRESLSQLANALGVSNQNHLPTLLADIEEGLDYEAWTKKIRRAKRKLQEAKEAEDQAWGISEAVEEGLKKAEKVAKEARGRLRQALVAHDRAESHPGSVSLSEAEEEHRNARKDNDNVRSKLVETRVKAAEARRRCQQSIRHLNEAQGELASLLKGVAEVEPEREESPRQEIRDFVGLFKRKGS